MKTDEEQVSKAIGKISEIMREQQELLLKRYPADVPNEVCRHAVISGILVENSPGFKVGEIIPLMKLPHEKIYVWTNRRNENSSILSEVDTSIKNMGFWTNAGHVFKLAHAYESWFEHIIEGYNYHWIYYFDPALRVEDSEFLNDNHVFAGTFNGSVKKATFFQSVAPLVDLMVFDEKFFTATSLMVQSMEFHLCCFWCEFQTGGYIMHPSHEPLYWEQASVLPLMESAIVQACRCVEGILGKPGRNRERMKQRWWDVLGTDPNDPFFKTDTTFLDYYYRLFELRNDSAHSYGSVVFQTTRQKTIEAQCFAWLILASYLTKHSKSNDEACKSICLNLELMQQVHPEMSTPITKED